MRIHLQLLDLEGTILAEGTFESPSLTLSAHLEYADFVHERLRHHDPYFIESDGYHAAIRKGSTRHRLRRKNLIAIGDELRLRVDLYPRADAVPKVRGACPSCGGMMRTAQVGGAYRSIAREEQRCGECNTAVIALDDAPATLGRFTDQSASDWVHVTVAPRCPRCTESLMRSVFRSAHGEAEVERCPRCQLVVIEPEDEARLTGHR